MGVILSVDQSTAGTKALLWNPDGSLIARADRPHRQITNDKGWVEHDPEEIYQNTLAAVDAVVEKAGGNPADIAVLGISNQRETAVCWDRVTGKPLYNAIVWQCSRAADVEAEIRSMGLADVVHRRTGMPLSPFFSAAKFGWMVRNVPAVAEAKQNGTLCCGTIDAWLCFKLTGAFKTDYSNASRTQLLNLQTLQWDAELARAFGLTVDCLPEICHSDSLFGTARLPFGKVPLHGMLGDSHAALFANKCLEPFTAKVTYGTGSSIMMNAGPWLPAISKGVAVSIAWGMHGVVDYVLEGNINYTGAVTKWLCEDVGLIQKPREAGEIAASVQDTGGVYLVPAFSGLGAPYFQNDVRAALVGMNRGTKKAHIVRAAEECIAYQIRDVVEAINACSAQPLSALRADGGPTHDGFLMQFQADMLGIPLEISGIEELSGGGAAYCAAIGSGVSDRATIFKSRTALRVTPGMPEAQRAGLYSGWQGAVAMISNGYNQGGIYK